MNQALLIKTTENRQRNLGMHFQPKPSGTWIFFRLTCSDTINNIWSYVIYECMENKVGQHMLSNIPPDQTKIWKVIRTRERFTLHCNGALVLDFNFQTDYAAGFSQCHGVWSRDTTAVNFNWKDEMYEPGYITIRISGKFLILKLFPRQLVLKSYPSRCNFRSDQYFLMR